MKEDGTYENLKQNSDAHFQLFKLHLKKQGKYNFNEQQTKLEEKTVLPLHKKFSGGSSDINWNCFSP